LAILLRGHRSEKATPMLLLDFKADPSIEVCPQRYNAYMSDTLRKSR
jgi:hypothetical protein